MTALFLAAAALRLMAARGAFRDDALPIDVVWPDDLPIDLADPIDGPLQSVAERGRAPICNLDTATDAPIETRQQRRRREQRARKGKTADRQQLAGRVS